MVLGRPPNSGTGLSAHAARSALSAHASSKSSQGTALHIDRTPLPKAVSEPGSAGVHHVAASSSVMITTFVGLAVVLGLIFGIYWLLKRYGNGGNGGGKKSDGRMRVLATTVLAPNRALHLVKVGSELVLVGSAENGVSPIRVYSAEESAALGDEIAGGQPAPLRATTTSSSSDKFGWGVQGFVTQLRARTVRQ